jgi:sugar transferase EpsL
MKRLVDVIGALVGLLVAAPVMAAVGAAIRWTMGPPVLFRQVRAGKDGRLFTLFKFRTMVPGSADDAARATPLGLLLRSTSLDELPELFNVLRGDMSLVGPRPLLPEYLPLYTPTQARRHEVRPGLTGYAQVNGRNSTSWTERLALDVEYVERRTMALDLAIIVRTVGAVFRREGIGHGSDVSMPRFTGQGPAGDAIA